MKLYRKFSSVPEIPNRDINEHYTPYVFLNRIFTDEEVERLIGFWKDDKARQGKVVTKEDHLDTETRRAKEVFIPAAGNEWIYDKIATVCTMINAGKFKFDITGFHECIRIVKYDAGDFFDWHMDNGAAEISVRKLAVSVQLSDENEYQGGELQLIRDNISMPKTKGTAAIFPSYVVHRVAPITSGSRLVLLSMIGGPPFR